MSWRERLRPEVAALRAYAPEPHGPGIRLDANECGYDLSAAERAAMVELAQAMAFHRYPEAGAPALRRAFAQHLGVDDDWVCMANGSDELLPILCTVFAGSGPGRPSLLIPTPTFSMYALCARPLGYDVHEVPRGPRFEIDAAGLGEAVCAHRPNLVFLASPNNPTGDVVDSAVVDAALTPGHSVVVVDEAYGPFADVGTSFLPRLSDTRDLALMFSLSKIGLAALRVGALVAEPALIAEVDKVRLPYNLDAFTAAAATTLLRAHHGAIAARILATVSERKRLARALATMEALDVFDSQANFVLVRAADGPALALALLERGIVVRNLHREGPLHDCLRMTVGTPAETDALLAALADALV